MSAVSGKLPSEHLIPARMWLTSLGFEQAFSVPSSFPAGLCGSVRVWMCGWVWVCGRLRWVGWWVWIAWVGV